MIVDVLSENLWIEGKPMGLVEWFKKNSLFCSKDLLTQNVSGVATYSSVSGEIELPKSVTIEVSNVCNLRCEYCALITGMNDKSIMTEGTFNLLEQYFACFDNIKMSGLAEPLVNDNLVKYIKKIKSCSPECQVGFVTNATLLTEEKASEIVDSGVDNIWFSIDAEDNLLSRKIRTGSDTETVLKHISYILDAKRKRGFDKPSLGGITVLQKKNYRELPKLVQLLADFGIHKLLVNGLEPYFRPLVHDVLWYAAKPADYDDVIAAATSLASKVGLQLTLASNVPLEAVCDRIMSPFILANGDVVPCPVLAYDRDFFFGINDCNRIELREGRSHKMIFGNIHDKNFAEIWNSEEYVRFRKQVSTRCFPDACKHCLIKHQFICA